MDSSPRSIVWKLPRLLQVYLVGLGRLFTPAAERPAQRESQRRLGVVAVRLERAGERVAADPDAGQRAEQSVRHRCAGYADLDVSCASQGRCDFVAVSRGSSTSCGRRSPRSRSRWRRRRRSRPRLSGHRRTALGRMQSCRTRPGRTACPTCAPRSVAPPTSSRGRSTLRDRRS